MPYLAGWELDDNATVFAGDFNFKAKPDHDAHPSYEHFAAQTPFTSSGQTALRGR